MLLPDETYEEHSSVGSVDSLGKKYCDGFTSDIDEVEAAKALAVLQKCDDFLRVYNIRPEFFCRHRERVELQKWLLQRSPKFSSGEFFYFLNNIINNFMYIKIEE